MTYFFIIPTIFIGIKELFGSEFSSLFFLFHRGYFLIIERYPRYNTNLTQHNIETIIQGKEIKLRRGLNGIYSKRDYPSNGYTF